MRLSTVFFLFAITAVSAQTYYGYYETHHPEEVYVDNVLGDDNVHDGSVGQPYLTIQRALDDTPYNIYVVPNGGVHTPYTGNLNTNLEYDLRNVSISIQSAIPGTKFYVDMQHNGRFIHVYNSLDANDRCINMTLVDAVLMNGAMDNEYYYDYYSHTFNGEYGGAIFAVNCTLNVQHVTFYLCHATYGGAIAFVGNRDYINLQGSEKKFRLRTSNCKFQFNTAEYGGAIYLAGSTNLTRNAALRSSQNLYQSNEAFENGGVVYATNKVDIKFTSDTMESNTAGVDGGVLYITGYSHSEFHTSVMDSNAASTGKGGVACADYHGAAMFYGCTFCSNFAALNGSVAFIPVPFHTVLDKPTNYFQCNTGQFPFCAGDDCQQIFFPQTTDYFEYLPDGECNACVAPSRRKRSGPPIVKPCVIQSTGTDTPGCGVAPNVSCATMQYAYSHEGCDEWRVVAGDTLTGTGNREVLIASHVHITCNGSAANCEGNGNQVTFNAGGIGNIFKLTSATTGSEADFNWVITNTNASAGANLTFPANSGGVDFKGSASSFIMAGLFHPRACENVTGIRGGCICAEYVAHDTIAVSRCLNCYATDEGGALWGLELRGSGVFSSFCTIDFNLTVACGTGGRGAIFYLGIASPYTGAFILTYGAHYAPHIYGPPTNITMLSTTYVGFSIYTETIGNLIASPTFTVQTTSIYGAVSGEPGQQRTLPHGLYEGFLGTNNPLATGPQVLVTRLTTLQDSMMIVDGLCYGDDAIGCASQVNKTKTAITTTLGVLFNSNDFFLLPVSNNIRVPSNGSAALLYDECCNINGGQFPLSTSNSRNVVPRCFILDGDLPDGDGRATQPYPVDVGNDGIHELFGYYDPPFTSEGMCTTSIWLLVDANCQNSTAVNGAIKQTLLRQYLQQPVTIRYSTFRSDGLVDTESGFTPMDFYYDFDNNTVAAATTYTAHVVLTDMLDYQGLNTTSPWATVIRNAWYQHEHYHAIPTFVFMITATGDSSAAASTTAARNAWTANGVTQFWGIHINSSVSSVNITTDMNNLFGGNWTVTANSSQAGIAAAIMSVMGQRYCNSSTAAALGCTLPVNENQYRLGTNCISGRSVCAKMQYNCTALACTTQNYTDENSNTFTNSPWVGNTRAYDDHCLAWMTGTDPYTFLFPGNMSPTFGLASFVGVGSGGRGFAQGICVGTSPTAAPTCGFYTSSFQFQNSLSHPDNINEPQIGTSTLANGDIVTDRCTRQQVLRAPRTRSSQTYTFRGYWDNNNVLQQECVPLPDNCYRGIYEHRDCRHNFLATTAGNYTWDNTTNCAYVALNEGGPCYRGECVSGAGVCVNGFCVGGTNNNSLCYDVYNYWFSWNLTMCPTCTACQNWTCNPSDPLADDRGCRFNGNYTAGTSCAPANSCVTNATCNSVGQCVVNTVNNTVCDDGDVSTTDTCDMRVSRKQNECINCKPGLYSACSDSSGPGYSNGFGFCFDTNNNCVNSGVTNGPYAQGSNCTVSSYHLCGASSSFPGLSNGTTGKYLGYPANGNLLGYTGEIYCSLDVCNSNSFGRCDINGFCDTCAGTTLPVCTAPRRSCVKLIGIVIEAQLFKAVQLQHTLDVLKEQIAIYAKERFVAISITIMTSNYAYSHCSYVDLSNSGTDDSMQKLLDCISSIPIPLGFSSTGFWMAGLGVYDTSIAKPDYIILISTAKSYNWNLNNPIIANRLRGNGTVLYGIWLTCGFFRTSRNDEGVTTASNAAVSTDIQDFDNTFGALDTFWYMAVTPIGVLNGVKVDVESNLTVAIRTIFNKTMPNSCPGHQPPCTTASLNITTCTCSVSTNVSANGQPCGSAVPNFPTCQQGTTCASGVCNTTSGYPVHTYCDDGYVNTTDTCNPTSILAKNTGCVNTIVTTFLDSCYSCQNGANYKFGQTLCPIRPGYECASIAAKYDWAPNICMRNTDYVGSGSVAIGTTQTAFLNVQWPYWQNYPSPQNIFQRNSHVCVDPTPPTAFVGINREYRCNCQNFTCGLLDTTFSGQGWAINNNYPLAPSTYNAQCLTNNMKDDYKCPYCFGQKCVPFWLESSDTITGCSPRNETLYANFLSQCLAVNPDIDPDCVTEVVCASGNTGINGTTVWEYRDGQTVDIRSQVNLISGTVGGVLCGFFINSGSPCCYGSTCIAGGTATGTCTRGGQCLSATFTTPALNCTDGLACTFDRCCPGSDFCAHAPISHVSAPSLLTNNPSNRIPSFISLTGATSPLPLCGGYDYTNAVFNPGLQFVTLPSSHYFINSPYQYIASGTQSDRQFFFNVGLDLEHLASIIVNWDFGFFTPTTVSTNARLTVVFSWRQGRAGTPVDVACIEIPSTTLANVTCASVTNLTANYITTFVPYETFSYNSTGIILWDDQWPTTYYRIPVANLSRQDTWVGIRVYSAGNQYLKFGADIVLDFIPGCETDYNCSDVSVCDYGSCDPGTPPSCDDYNPCTLDSCNVATDNCTHTNYAVGTPCDILGSCYVNSVCNATGVCSGGNHVCDSKPSVVCGSWKCGLTGTAPDNSTITITNAWQAMGIYECMRVARGIQGFFGPASVPTSVATNDIFKMGSGIAVAGEGCPVHTGQLYGPAFDGGNLILANSTTDAFSSFSIATNNDGSIFVEGDPYWTDVEVSSIYTNPLNAGSENRVTPYPAVIGDSIVMERVILMLGNYSYQAPGNYYYDTPGRITIWSNKNSTNLPDSSSTGDPRTQVRQRIQFPLAADATRALFGFAVAMSNDSTVIAASAPAYNGNTGAVWVFFLNTTSKLWQPTGTGAPLVFTGNATAGSAGLQFGISLHMAYNGKTLAVGAPGDNNNTGAVWIFTGDSSGSAWTQLGSKLVGTGSLASVTCQGASVALSTAADILAVGGACETVSGSAFGGVVGSFYPSPLVTSYSNTTNRGTVWIFRKVAGIYSQQQVIQSPIAISNFGRNIAMDGASQTLLVADGLPLVYGVVPTLALQGGVYMYFRDNMTDTFASVNITALYSNPSLMATVTTVAISNNGEVFATRIDTRTEVDSAGQPIIFEKVLNVAACNAQFDAGTCDYGSNATCAFGNCTAFNTCTMVANDTLCLGGPCSECNNFMCSPFSPGANATTGCTGMFYPDLSPCSSCFQDNITCTVQTCNSTHNCVTTPINSLCDDSDPCTLDICNVTTGCVHTLINGTGAVCTTNSSCNDANSCTTDYCCGGRCLYVSNNGDYNGMCQVVGFNETIGCPDCLGCNNNTICEKYENAATCPNDCNHCNSNGVCDPNEGEQCVDCQSTPCIPDGICAQNENGHNCAPDCTGCDYDGICDVTENTSCPDCCSSCVTTDVHF